MDPATDETKWIQLSRLANRKRTISTFERLLAAGFDPILLKGWSVERFYDGEHYRVSTDIDLLFQADAAEQIIGYLPALNKIAVVDLHFHPLHLDKLDFQDLHAKSYTVDLDGVPIRLLADEDNLRITSVHWLTDGGVNKEKLWDVYYLVKNRKEDFDWDRCLESNGPVRKTWVMAAIATARDHLELDVADVPADVQEFVLPLWYEKTLAKEWRLGLYPRRVLSTVIFRPTLLFEQLRRKVPPNRIAATIDTETPIDGASRLPAQIKSLTKKAGSFARGLGRRITYSIRGKRK